MDFQKTVAAVGALVVGVFVTLGIDVSPLVEAVGATVLVATPIVVHWVRNGGIDTVGYNKLAVAVPAGVIGVLSYFGVEASDTVNSVKDVYLLALPVLVFAVPSIFAANDQLE